MHQVLAIEPLHPSAAMELNEVGEAAYRNGDRAAAERLFAEARQLGGDEAEYDYQNRLGNLRYWHGEYETAADYYRKAIAARPGEAVLHSNLALALEHLHTPGRQAIEWQEILAALTEAARLAPSIAEYPMRLRAARQKLDFLSRYGESALAFKHAGTPIRVDVSPPLLAAVLKPDTQDLSPETLDRIKLMRERLRSQTGVHLPGVLFGEFADTSAGQDMMQISFFDEPLKTSTVAAPPHPGATIDILMQQLEGEIRRQCECFVTHQETAFSLTECTEPVCTEIRRAPLQLTAFVKFLRARLKDGESIAETARLAERFSFKVPALPLPRDATPWSWETAPQATRILVLLGPISPAQKIAIEADLEAARNSLLDYFGILVPRLQFRIDTEIPLHSFQFSIGDREFPPQQGLQQDEIWIAADPSSLPSEWKPRPWTVQGGTAGAVCYATAEHIRTRFPEKLVLDGTDVTRLELGFQLGRNLDLCIDQAQVEHRLALITPSYPALVESARARFGLEELVVLLRERFMASVSLRNFPATLERFLIETPLPMAKPDDIESRIAK